MDCQSQTQKKQTKKSGHLIDLIGEGFSTEEKANLRAVSTAAMSSKSTLSQASAMATSPTGSSSHMAMDAAAEAGSTRCYIDLLYTTSVRLWRLAWESRSTSGGVGFGGGLRLGLEQARREHLEPIQAKNTY